MTDWEFEMPEDQDETPLATEAPEDAAIRDARAKAARIAAEKEEFARETLVIQKGLPRPKVVDYDAMVKKAEAMQDPIRREIALETAKVIAYDAMKHGGAKIIGNPPMITPLTVEERASVRKAVEEECTKMDKELGMTREEVINSISAIHEKKCKIPGIDAYDDSDEEDIDEMELMKETLAKVQKKIMADAAKGNEIEAKLEKYHGGYMKRTKMLRDKMESAHDQLEDVNIKINTANYAQVREEAAVARRLEKKQEEVKTVKANEMAAQVEYRKVKAEWDALNAAQPNGDL
jgi:pre-mRNA-splicing factor CDC5/CEF1